jgi:uncharacterized protein YndB with AHSA1/START domain
MTRPLAGTLENRDGAWVLTLIREFKHPAETVWPWLTDPDRLRQWSPVSPDRPFDSVGPRQVRENPHDDPVTGEVLTVEPPMNWCTGGATTWCAGASRRPTPVAG